MGDTMTAMRVLLIVGAVAVAVVLFFVLRTENETPFEPAGPPMTQGGPETRTATAPTAAPVTPQRVGLVARVQIREGQPVGGVQHFRVRKGGRVQLIVRADIADHVHVHGYDVIGEVAPGSPARLAFTANLTGRFEVELEDRGLPIAELEVRP